MSSPLPPRGRAATQAFTLIELLAVIALIAVLAGITFGVVGGVKKRANASHAKTELATLAQALEAYKRQYGDYPQTGRSSGDPKEKATDKMPEGQLFNALAGKYGPTLEKIQGKSFVDLAKYSMQYPDETKADTEELPTPGNATTVNNAFVDPWGNLYLYSYKSKDNKSDWKIPSYILVSAGPDEKLGITVGPNGEISESDAVAAADNIYANK